MLAKIRAAIAPVTPYETRWPLRAYAVRSGERICGLEHRKLRGNCSRCGAAR